MSFSAALLESVLLSGGVDDSLLGVDEVVDDSVVELSATFTVTEEVLPVEEVIYRRGVASDTVLREIGSPCRAVKNGNKTIK